MSTMNISLPDALKEFVEGQVAEQGYGTSSEYVRELIRKDRDRQSLRARLTRPTSTTFAAASATPTAGERQAGHPTGAGEPRCR